jgi:1-aminocyclopropane-1-carboxylate deaminase/D-cysteine desulfhydrase-like pyridoxal-dependent ACC family enzyme
MFGCYACIVATGNACCGLCSVQACGSAGTTAGLAMGAKLSGLCPSVEGYMVCDDDKYFHDTINELYQELGYTQASTYYVVCRVYSVGGPPGGGGT